MDWLSKCVCGSRAPGSENFEKNNRKKKKKQSKRKKSGEKYLREDEKSLDEVAEGSETNPVNGKLVALIKGHRLDKSDEKLENIRENKSDKKWKYIREGESNNVPETNYYRERGDTTKDETTAETISESAVSRRFNEAKIGEEDPRGLANSSNGIGSTSSRTSDKWSPTANGGCRRLGQSTTFKITGEEGRTNGKGGKRIGSPKLRVCSSEDIEANGILFGREDRLDDNSEGGSINLRNSTNFSSFRGRNKFGYRGSATPGSPVNDKDFRINSNSCSFVIPIDDANSKASRKSEKKGVANSHIPKPSTKSRGSKDLEEAVRVPNSSKNGRVHSAIVSGVNWEQRSVTVEWFEKGETKGKEVEIDAILALNPELAPKSMPPPQMNNMLSSTRARHSTRPSIPVKAGSNRQISRQVTGSRPTNIMPPASSVNGHSDTVAGLTGRREVENIPPTPTMPSNLTSTSLIKQKQIQQQQQQPPPPPPPAQQPVATQQPAQVENGRGRRSNVVKEVERLKKNREERRQRQAELKEEKEALMNLDPGNPNWEFLAMIREYQNSIDFRPLRESDSVEDHQITVCVRKRPLNRKELNRKEVDVISVPSKDQMVVHEPKAKVDLTKYLENQLFRFDYAFDETCNNEIVYKYTAKPLVQTIFEGGMATCFAYGQTGSGKTHTMGGDFNGKTQDCKKGVYAMVAKDVFKCLKSAKYRPLNLVISASFFEIYSGKVFDLLADKVKLRVLEDGKQQVQIVGLTEKVVETCDEVLKLIQHGNSARTSGQTSANSNSSRSHAVFQIIARTPSTHKVHGKFSLIDLAGNERGADTSSANRQTRMEGAEINKSLLALKECIRALGRKGTHLPFRASKLTQVLRDSFIGENSRTCMIAMISPGMSSCEHSLNTLRYADRVKELAATDPTEMKVSPTDDDRVLKIEDQANNSALSDSDLAQLRSLNEGELSQDLFTFHEAVSALQLLEEEVLDTHKAVIDHTGRFLNGAHSVFTATHEVDYDQDAYAQKWEDLLVQQRDTLNAALDQVSQFRSQLLEEEQISQKMTRPRNPRYN